MNVMRVRIVTQSFRHRKVGTTLAAKVWQSGSTEPTSWMLQVTDNVFPSGRGGLRSNMNSGTTLQITQFILTKASSL